MKYIIAILTLLISTQLSEANPVLLQGKSIIAPGCVVVGTPTGKPDLSVGEWDLNRLGKAYLVCPVPIMITEATVIDKVRILYRDPDGIMGNASVKVYLMGLEVDPYTQNSIDGTYVCQFRSNVDGGNVTTWQVAEMICDTVHPVPVGDHLAVFIELWRRNTVGTLGFGGVDFP